MNDYLDAKNRRKADTKKERIVSSYLEKYFYPSIGTTTIEIDDRETQLKGVDKIFTYKNFKYLCDEKASTGEKYYNKYSVDYRKLNTFCLECRQKPLRENFFVDGWFLNTDKLTNSYLFVFVDEANPIEWTDESDIIETEIYLVKNDTIKEYLNNRGFDENRIREICTSFEKDNDKEAFYDNGIKFNHLSYFKENPINMQLKREDYFKMADHVCRFTRNNNNRVIKETLK